tara:strand:- start:2523 stop:3605 length:1083 start_codon:yes stop_codon:yes gene_type:complete
MDYKSYIEIDGKRIGENYPTYFIADIAANHDGDIGRAKELIHLSKEAGADAAKFQHFSADTIVSKTKFEELNDQNKSHQSNWKKSVFEVYKDASVSLDWTMELVEECKKANITFFTSPYSLELVDYIDDFVPAFKIGSGDITWIEIIEHIASKNKPFILATGASSLDDVCRAVKAATSINKDFALMQCNTNYTAERENLKYVNLNVLEVYKKMFPGMVMGLSDHTDGDISVLGSVALGSRVIEKHFTDDTDRDGPDHKFSMDPSSWKLMVERTRDLEMCLGDGLKKIEENELHSSVVQRRGLQLNKDISKGKSIKEDDLFPLRPCTAESIPPYEKAKLVGSKANKELKAGSYISWKDLEG